mgnify:FL=1
MNQDGYRVVELFLASSIHDTEQERDKLQNKIMAVWNPIFQAFGTELHVIRCEEMKEEWPNRNQAAIDEKIRAADVFIVIFKNVIGTYTYHEFQVAKETFSEKGTPHIYPYVSNWLMEQKESFAQLQELTRNDSYPETFSAYEAIEISLLERLGKELSLNIRTHRNGTMTVNGTAEDFDLSAEQVCKAYQLRQKEYIDFSVRLLRPLYPELSVLQYFGQEFPDSVIEAEDSVRGFDCDTWSFALSDSSMLLRAPSVPVSEPERAFLEEHCGERRKQLNFPYRFYHYMNDSFELTKDGKLHGIRAYVGPARENSVSTMALYNEVEQLYAASKHQKDAPLLTEQNSPVRTAIQKKAGTGSASLTNGYGRASGLGIQLVVLFPMDAQNAKRISPKFHRYAGKGHYWTPLVRRSDSAWEQPGFYQFAPCGNFMIFDEPEAAEKDWNVQKQDFDFFRAIQHHYVRELFSGACASEGRKFGDSPFDKPDHAAMYDKAAGDSHAEELYKMLSDGRASLEFLGCSSVLTALKSDLVFLLVIDDETYFEHSKKDFKSDFVAASLRPYPLEYLMTPDFLDGENCLAQELVGPLELLKTSRLLQKRTKTE